MAMQIRRAERRKAKLRLALIGPTGSVRPTPPSSWRSVSEARSALSTQSTGLAICTPILAITT